jgi:hypothetical protein
MPPKKKEEPEPEPVEKKDPMDVRAPPSRARLAARYRCRLGRRRRPVRSAG